MAPAEIPAPRGEDYALLGVPETATMREIKLAYFALAKASHPDVVHAADGTSHTFDAYTQSYDRICAYRKAHPEVDSLPPEGWTVRDLPMHCTVWASPHAVLIAPSGICYLAPEAHCSPYASNTAVVRIDRDSGGYHVHLQCGQGQRWPITAHADRQGLEVTSLAIWLTTDTTSPMAAQFIGTAPMVSSSPPRLPRSFIQRSVSSLGHRTIG